MAGTNVSSNRSRSALKPAERIDFTRSVQCLMNLPPKTPIEVAPGVTSRYDDFTATHINNTLLIHVNGPFLAWHRHFLYLFQKALTDECGFKGTLPYWNWPWWSDDLLSSPLFDGSATSLGGDGYYNASMPPFSNGNYTFPRGHGGGCIKEGPFANITTGFRNFKNEEILAGTLPPDALDYAPHCVTRDLNSVISSPSHQPEVVHELLVADSIRAFQSVMDGTVRNTSHLSPHSAGHWSVGTGMQDQYASPSDPVFYLHHSMIDNMWAQWQLRDRETRTFALDGTVTTLNNPPSQNATLDWVVDFGWLDTPKRLGEIMDSQSGLYCYRYEYKEASEKPC
ncbi:tyrosinase central domain protein [Paraphaeosphaeria sporulosa]|uniref:Tyrosinase central domain protein n=1 Tax=Paraphaeosphaeria sporulosa TaxID=1460663 RepID=A0A177CM76_9PLEO|nr:tyrosinase central domain protein [Paraphaeosphaeria sporulosa]OAG08361.1 tyrosinase central domain protein [Paraphaeosphaeria sporulosa]